MSNLGTLSRYVTVFKDTINHYQAFTDPGQIGSGTEQERFQALGKELAAICPPSELTYILEDVDSLLEESRDGTRRVQEIVQSLKSFSRVDETEERETSLNECIETTLKIVWNELKYKCTVHKQLGELPMIRCNPGHLNQVFMNLLVNAAQAIEERGEITIETRQVSPEQVMVRIADTGNGIPPEALSQIFNPFFTTKPIGQGTGLGLSISYSIIQKHNGTIDVQSEVGRGTTFTILLPVG
jgi:two-component system NtrC family sensor kinase